MLKKILHIAFVILLMVATSGFTITRHYCGNQLFSVTVFNNDKCTCGDKCKDCHTDIRQVKVTDNYAASEPIHPDAPNSLDLFFVYNIEFNTFAFPTALTAFILLKPPPPGVENSTALLQSFRC